MSRSDHSRRGARALATGTLAVVFGIAVGAARAEQSGADTTSAAAPAATAEAANVAAPAAEPQQSARERRRAEKAAAQAPEQEASEVIASLAAEAAAAPAAESVEVDSAPVCKDRRVTGSRVSRRVCQTPAQAAASERAAEEGMRQMRDRTTVVIRPPENPLAAPN